MSEREKYEALYGNQRQISDADRATFRSIWRSVWGDDFPYEVGPNNWITWAELRRIPNELRVASGSTLLDLGCGSGGPGLWVSDKAAAAVVGIDLSEKAVEAARKQAATRYANIAAQYRVADMSRTGLASESFDAAISIDAVQLAPERAAVFSEVARVLRPGSRFVFTTWDHPQGLPREALRPDRQVVVDSRPLLEGAGFRVVAYDRISTWDDRGPATYRAILDHREVVAAVAGEGLVREAMWGIDYAHHATHVFVICELARSHGAA